MSIIEEAAVEAASPPDVGAPNAVRPPLIIRPPGRWPMFDWAELRSYRGLLGFLVWREIKIRYAQTVLGAGWALLQPLLTMAIFTLIFGRFAGVPSDGVPYSAFVLAALVPWTYFSTAVNNAGNSLVMSTNMITKIYFPRVMIPVAPVLAGLLDLAFASLLLVGMMTVFGLSPSPWAIPVVPLLVTVMVLTAAGVGSWLAALNIRYRDVKYAAPFLVQVWMYMSPIVYPMSIVPERYRTLFALNPMAGIIEGFRAVLLRTETIPPTTIALSLCVGLVIFVAGTLYFRASEQAFADVA